MIIEGKKIAAFLEKSLKKEVSALKKKKKKKLHLVTFLIGQSKDQISFVKIKAKVAKKLGIVFELVHLKTVPSFEKFMQLLKEKSDDREVTGILIQQPLPAALSTESIYDYIPDLKEIEGHGRKSPFTPPIGLAVLTVLKFIFSGLKTKNALVENLEKERLFFKRMCKNKRTVLIGRGITGGQPIGLTLSQASINYININSQTPSPATYIQEADIVISAVGKKVILPTMLKPGTILINVGLRNENNRLKGDYDEKEIRDIANYYTPTPGGVGPIDVLYLYKNLVDAAKMQK